MFIFKLLVVVLAGLILSAVFVDISDTVEDKANKPKTKKNSKKKK